MSLGSLRNLLGLLHHKRKANERNKEVFVLAKDVFFKSGVFGGGGGGGWEGLISFSNYPLFIKYRNRLLTLCIMPLH